MSADLKLGTVEGFSITGRAQVRLDGAADAINMNRPKNLDLIKGDRVVCAYIRGIYIVILAILNGGASNGEQ